MTEIFNTGTGAGKLKIFADSNLAKRYKLGLYSCATPFTLGFDREDTLDSSIAFYSGTIVLRFLDNSQVNLIKLLNEFDYGDVKVEIEAAIHSDNRVRTWKGFLEPFLSGGNVFHLPNELELNYVDGVGRLAEKDFTLNENPIWNGYDGGLVGGSYITVFNVLYYGLKAGGIDIDTLTYKPSIRLDKGAFNLSDGIQDLRELCVPRRFLMDEEGPKKVLAIFQDILMGLGLNMFVYGNDLILHPKVDYFPEDAWVKLGLSNIPDSVPAHSPYLIDRFGSGGKSFYPIGSVTVREPFVRNPVTSIQFNSDSSAMSYLDKGEVLTTRSINSNKIKDILKSDKNYVEDFSILRSYNTYGGVVGGFQIDPQATTQTFKPNIASDKIDGFILRQSAVYNSTNDPLERNYRILIPEPRDPEKKYQGFALKFDLKGQIGYVTREIGIIGKEFPYVMLRCEFEINSIVRTKFATVNTTNEREQTSSVIMDLKEFGNISPGIIFVKLKVSLCETMPNNPEMIKSSTKKILLQHTEVQPSLIGANSYSSDRIAMATTSILKAGAKAGSKDTYDFQFAGDGRSWELDVPDKIKADNLLRINNGKAVDGLYEWDTTRGMFHLLRALALMDEDYVDGNTGHVYWGQAVGYKRRLNLLSIDKGDSCPIQIVSNGLRFPFAPFYLRDRIHYEVGLSNQVADVSYNPIADPNVFDAANHGRRYEDITDEQRDKTIFNDYYDRIPEASNSPIRSTIVSLTSLNRSIADEQTIDIDILDSFINPENKIKVDFPGDRSFDNIKSLHGSAFIAIEVEPIVNQLSLTFKFASRNVWGSDGTRTQINGQVNMDMYPISDKFWSVDRNLYTSDRDSVGFSVHASNINQAPKVKIHYITVEHGEYRTVGTFDIPFCVLGTGSQLNLPLANYILREDRFGPLILRQDLSEIAKSQKQTLGRGAKTKVLPSYFCLRDMRSWLNDSKTPIPPRDIFEDKKFSEFYYILKEIEIVAYDVTYLIQEQGNVLPNTLPTQVSEWQGIDEEYGEEDKALYNFSIVQGTLHDSWTRYKRARQVLYFH